MALRIIESVGHANLPSLLATKWNQFANGSFTSNGGRRSGQHCFTFSGATRLETLLDTQGTWIMGGAFKSSSLSSGINWFGIKDGGNIQLDVRLDSSGRLILTRNGTTIGTGTTILVINQWYYIELKAVIASSGGSAEVRLSGATEITFSGDTAATANDSGDTPFFGTTSGSTPNLSACDMYVCDGSGSANNNFLGDCRVDALFPSGAGNSTQWTPSAGSNYQNVDEVTPNSDTDYNSSSTVSNKDTFAMADLATSGETVYGVQQVTYHRKSDAGSRTLRQVIRRSGTDYESASVTVLDAYSYAVRMLEQDPSTSAAWTDTGVNAIEAGYKLQS